MQQTMTRPASAVEQMEGEDLCRRRTRIICECMGIVTVTSGGITTVRAIPVLSHHQVCCSWVVRSVFQGAQLCVFWQVPYRRSPLLNTASVSRLMRHAACHMRALFRPLQFSAVSGIVYRNVCPSVPVFHMCRNPEAAVLAALSRLSRKPSF